MVKVDFTELSTHRHPQQSPGFLLWRASVRWRRHIEAVLKPIGLTHPQFVILASVGWLTREGEHTTQAKVAQHAELDPNTTSQILRGLEAKGWIRRKQVQDERSKCPELTPPGAKQLKKALPAVEAADAIFFENVDLKQVQALKALQTLAGF